MGGGGRNRKRAEKSLHPFYFPVNVDVLHYTYIQVCIYLQDMDIYIALVTDSRLIAVTS